ncbi:hypothetical protein [Vagococcus sp. WN89Y]|uniref:hypothetical protein n=1 Tax=Vagococcus sp. WN89Y TaxID=3457258 RepID=UPI003FCDDC2C
MFCSDDATIRLPKFIPKNKIATLPPAELGSGNGDNRDNQHNDGGFSHENSSTGAKRQKSIVEEIKHNKFLLKPA